MKLIRQLRGRRIRKEQVRDQGKAPPGDLNLRSMPEERDCRPHPDMCRTDKLVRYLQHCRHHISVTKKIILVLETVISKEICEHREEGKCVSGPELRHDAGKRLDPAAFRHSPRRTVEKQ